MQLLAILGRGIRKKPDCSWIPTRDLEMYGDSFTHIAKLQPLDDASPNCLVGGGTLNVRAGAALCAEYRGKLQAVVCAYGGRSRYLTDINAPSEAEVMSECLAALLSEFARPQIIVWPWELQVESGKTSTDQELQNILKLAVTRGYEHVGIVTVLVHYARTVLMASRHLLNPALAHLLLQCFVSEEILCRSGHLDILDRIMRLRTSQAFMRTLFYEQRGINALLDGKY